MPRIARRRLSGAVALAMAALAAAASGQAQDGSRTVWDGVYSEAQAERGAKRYADTCAMCHGVDMTGGPGVPGLAGVEFLFAYNNKTAGDLFDYLKMNMPPGQQGTLSDQQYVDLVAAAFKRNGFPAGTTELSGDAAALAQVRILRARPQ